MNEYVELPEIPCELCDESFCDMHMRYEMEIDSINDDHRIELEAINRELAEIKLYARMLRVGLSLFECGDGCNGCLVCRAPESLNDGVDND